MSAEHRRPIAPGRHASDVVEVVPEIGLVADEWDDLVDRVAADPFARPGWATAWMRSFAPAGRLGVVTLRRGGRLAALVPLLRVGSTTRSLTNEHTPRVRLLGEDPEAEERLARELLRLRHRRLSVSPLAADGPSLAALRTAAASAGHRAVERVELRSPTLPLVGVAKAEDVLGRGRRKDLRRCRRRLDEAGRVEAVIETGGEGLESSLADSFAVEERQWKGGDGTAITSSARTHAFYLDVARWAARAGTLRLVTLRLDGRVIAFELDVMEPTGLYSLKAGFDPDHARFSPGHLVALAAIDEAIAAGVPSYELLGDAEPYKLVWTEDVRELRSIDVTPPTPGGSLAYVGRRYVRPARRRIARQLAAGASSLRAGGR